MARMMTRAMKPIIILAQRPPPHRPALPSLLGVRVRPLPGEVVAPSCPASPAAVAGAAAVVVVATAGATEAVVTVETGTAVATDAAIEGVAAAVLIRTEAATRARVVTQRLRPGAVLGGASVTRSRSSRLILSPMSVNSRSGRTSFT